MTEERREGTDPYRHKEPESDPGEEEDVRVSSTVGRVTGLKVGPEVGSRV